MTQEQTKNTLAKVINTLNTVEVKGRANMDHLLGCILTLEDMVRGMNEPETPDDISIEVEEVTPNEENPTE